MHYSTGNSGRALGRPIGTITTKHQWAICNGDRIRMLNADEYRQAMGFPAGYILPGKVSHAVKVLGNAVPPPVGKALVESIQRAEAA